MDNVAIFKEELGTLAAEIQMKKQFTLRNKEADGEKITNAF